MAAPVPFSKEAQVLDLFPHKSCDYELPSTFSKLPFIEALSERPSLYNSDSNLAALSSSSIEDEKELLPPPTRKRQLIVLISGFFIVFQTIGLNQSYGIFQAYYVEPNNGMLSSSQAENTAMIALIGTLGAGLTWGGSIFVNPLMARTKRLSHITIAGAILTSLGIGLASSCTQIWQLILTQGLIYGIGSSMLYFPIVSVAPEYFDRHRGTAMGIVLSGAGVGGLVLSPLIHLMIEQVGIRMALRILAPMNFIITLPIALCASPSRSVIRRPSLVNFSIARKPAFILQTLANLIQAAGNFVPLTFLSQFSGTMGYTAQFATILLSINNGVNSLSRLGMGVLADYAGRQNTLIVSLFGSAMCVLGLWMGATHGEGVKELWLAFVVAYGILGGGFNALFPTTVSDIFGIDEYPSVNGFLYFVRGLGAFGSPVGGRILGDSTKVGPGYDVATALAKWRGLIWYDGALLMFSTLCVMGVRWFDAKEKGKWKWKA